MIIKPIVRTVSLSIVAGLFMAGTAVAETSYNTMLPMMDTCGRIVLTQKEKDTFEHCIQAFMIAHRVEVARNWGRRPSNEEMAITERRQNQRCMTYHTMPILAWVDLQGVPRPLEKMQSGVLAVFEKQPVLPKPGAECFPQTKTVEPAKQETSLPKTVNK